jgi:proton-dependent oligopeptide transporter, POT family
MTSTTANDTTRFTAPTDLLGHPRGLAFLFATEMWERFSYYGMRALLVLYMVKYLLLPAQSGQVIGLAQLKNLLESMYGPLEAQPFSSLIYGLYTALVYSTPLMGGFIADRYLGKHRTIVIGATYMAIGHFMMAFEPLFLFALTMLILGNGCFKPNMSAQVGNLYATGDSRRDRAYSIFYVGINLGAFLAPLVCGTLGEEVGWHYGFGAAGVGMIIGIIVYLAALHTRSLPPRELLRIKAGSSEEKHAPKIDELYPSIWSQIPGFVLSMLAVAPIMLIYVLIMIMLVGFFVAIGTYLAIPILLLGVVALYAVLRRLPREERVAITALLVLFLPNTFFWATYEQQGNTIALWADDFTDRTINLIVWHGEIPVTWFQAFNPFMIFAFTPFVVAFWAWQARRGREPSTVVKMSLGCLGCALSYVIMALAAWQAQGDQASWLWLFAYFIVITIGELYLSPIGLSLVSKVAPARMVSMMMGVWLATSFVGNFGAGWLGSFWSSMDKTSFFLMIAGVAAFASVAIWVFNRPLRAVLKD